MTAYFIFSIVIGLSGLVVGFCGVEIANKVVKENETLKYKNKRLERQKKTLQEELGMRDFYESVKEVM